MDRRAFICSIAGGVIAAPLAVYAQSTGKTWRIGFLREGRAPLAPSYLEALRKLDWVGGRNIMIEPRYRGRGYGRGIIEAVEHELIIRGVDRLGLNVFGHNTVALRLYESMGFSMTSQQMAKTLTEPSTQQPSTQPG